MKGKDFSGVVTGTSVKKYDSITLYLEIFGVYKESDEERIRKGKPITLPNARNARPVRISCRVFGETASEIKGATDKRKNNLSKLGHRRHI